MYSQKRRYHRIQLLISVLLATSFSQGNAIEGTLNKAISDALLNDSEYLGSVERYKADLQRIPLARSYLLPEISAQINESYIDETLAAPDVPFVTPGEAAYRGRNYNIQLRQVLFNRELFSNFSKSKLYVALAKIELEISRQSLEKRTLKAYISVLNNKDNVDIADARIKLAKQQLDLVSERLHEGLASNSEFQQTNAQWLVAKASLISAKSELDISSNKLSLITGFHYASFSDVDYKEPYFLESDTLTNNQNILDNNLKYLKQSLIVGIAEKEAESQKSKHYPNLSLIHRYSNNFNDGSLSGHASKSTNSSTMLQLEIPFFTGGRVKAGIKQAIHLKAEQEIILQNVRKSVFLEISNLRSQLRALTQSLSALEHAFNAQKSLLATNSELYKIGVISNTEVLESQKKYLETKKKWLASKREFILTYKNLEFYGSK